MWWLIYGLRYVLKTAYVMVNIQFTLRVKESLWWLIYSLRYVLKRAYVVVNIQFTLRVKENLCGG